MSRRGLGRGRVEGQLEDDFAVLGGKVGEEGEPDLLAFGGGGGGAVDAVKIEIDAGLAEGVPVGQVGRRGIFEVDREAGGVRVETDAASRRREAEVPDGGGEIGLMSSCWFSVSQGRPLTRRRGP